MPTGVYKRKKGVKYGMFGKRHSEETKKKLSLVQKEYLKNHLSPNTGKKHSEETKRKLRQINLGKNLSEITKLKIKKATSGKNNSFYGKKHSKETKKRMSIVHSDISKETRKKMGLSRLGKRASKESIRKRRITRIKQIELNYGICYPSYNKKACEFFKEFDEKHNTKGRYAMYGNGEYQIKQLGYFLDYINFDKKVIMEWDENYHFNQDGSLKEKDISRQEEIKEYFPDFLFARINEENKTIIIK